MSKLPLRMAERLGAEEVVVLTSRWHLPRSSWTFRVVAAALRSRMRLGEAPAEAAEGEKGRYLQDVRQVFDTPNYVQSLL